MRVDVRATRWLSIYFSSGFSTKNNITFYSEQANKRQRASAYNTYFYSRNIPPTLFFNLGIVLKFGKTKSYYNDKNIYDAIDLNSDGANMNGNSQVPLPPKAQSKINLESVQDLIDYSEY
jgi:hypothetical protein